MAGLLDFIKTPRSDNPNRKASLAGRSQVYNLLDNIIGFNDDRVTPGEALGAGLRTNPIGLLSGAVRGVEGDLSNLMFEGGAMQRPQDVLGYAAAPMAPGAVSGRMTNVLSSGGAKPKSITAYHGGTGDVANAAGGRGAWFSENKDLADEYAFGGGSVNQFSISPQRPIEFLHAEQRRPIGDLISTAVENAGDLSDETISAARGKISALQKRYGEEKRPLFEYWNKDPDIADLFRTLGYDSISVAEKSGGPQTWAALTPDIISPSTPSRALNPSEQMAKDILDMRAAGRAGEVTDEMMAQADPQYMFANTPLPMDEASRLARAEEAGFENRLYYHGTDAPEITAFYPSMGAERLPATFLTDSRRVAETYGDNVGEYFARYDNPAEFYFDGGSSTYFDNESLFPGGLVRRIKEATDDAARYGAEVDTDLAFDLKSAGVDPMFADEIDAVKMRNVVDDFGWGGSPANNVAIYDPANIRRRSARFDPEFRHLRNLSAGVGGMGLLGMSYPQEEQY